MPARRSPTSSSSPTTTALPHSIRRSLSPPPAAAPSHSIPSTRLALPLQPGPPMPDALPSHLLLARHPSGPQSCASCPPWLAGWLAGWHVSPRARILIPDLRCRSPSPLSVRHLPPGHDPTLPAGGGGGLGGARRQTGLGWVVLFPGLGLAGLRFGFGVVMAGRDEAGVEWGGVGWGGVQAFGSVSGLVLVWGLKVWGLGMWWVVAGLDGERRDGGGAGGFWI
jgi:hypothetical protein